MAPSLTSTIKEKMYFLTSTIEEEIKPIDIHTKLILVLQFTMGTLHYMGIIELSECHNEPQDFIPCPSDISFSNGFGAPFFLAAYVLSIFATLIISIQFLKYAFDSFLFACGYIVQRFAKNDQLEFSCKDHAVLHC